MDSLQTYNLKGKQMENKFLKHSSLVACCFSFLLLLFFGEIMQCIPLASEMEKSRLKMLNTTIKISTVVLLLGRPIKEKK